MLSPEQKKERMWAMFCHLSVLAAFVVTLPMANVIAPLIVWLIKKNEIPAVDKHGKESLNFQISMTIYAVIAFLLCFAFIGFFIIIPLVVTNMILVIVASVKAYNGEYYQYPLAIRIIK